MFATLFLQESRSFGMVEAYAKLSSVVTTVFHVH